jgi:hypothetical protein
VLRVTLKNHGREMSRTFSQYLSNLRTLLLAFGRAGVAALPQPS